MKFEDISKVLNVFEVLALEKNLSSVLKLNVIRGLKVLRAENCSLNEINRHLIDKYAMKDENGQKAICVKDSLSVYAFGENETKYIEEFKKVLQEDFDFDVKLDINDELIQCLNSSNLLILEQNKIIKEI